MPFPPLLQPPPTVASLTRQNCKQGSQHGLTDPNLGVRATRSHLNPPHQTLQSQSATLRAIKAASTASQTQIWERAGKDGLALQPLLPLPYTNDSYP
ncbi:hypothetical protein EJ02DRAFT_457997 [Clathrospora elynae]|uniref:Uncharacterized protein n=1 Tax=Clathrospora elynae TaxID=706981 RepID=A0A6A5SFP8_9PLEO|nr:hypothetical protein EJ02DRAFT_457997 [Clathrospora elynae]